MANALHCFVEYMAWRRFMFLAELVLCDVYNLWQPLRIIRLVRSLHLHLT